jgi:hypothetical protein
MTRTKAFGLVFLATLSACSLHRPGEIANGSSQIAGVFFRYSTAVEPPLPPGQQLATGSGFATASPNRVHRFLADKPTSRCFGYDLVVEPISASGRYRVSFEPLDVDAEHLNVLCSPHNGPPSNWTAELLPAYPAPQTVSLGDTIALDVLASPDGQRKVVDYIQIYTPLFR